MFGKSNFKKLICTATVIATLTSNLFIYKPVHAQSINANYIQSPNDYGLAKNTKKGVILHAWNWSFNTIRNNLKNIAEAGYTSVQVSPIQGTKENAMDTGHWWLMYQPTNFQIGNRQLGSRDDFKNLCSEAHKYGIKIIVDIVANHTANRGGDNNELWPSDNVDPDLKNDSSCWHQIHEKVNDWDNRYRVTNCCIGEPDLNTASHKVQNKVIGLLNDCVDCGADGFRFDAAKSIELPCNDETPSDFWDRVLGSIKNRDRLFIYGEILQGGADNFYNYSRYMNVTASDYGFSARQSVGFDPKNYMPKSVDKLFDYKSKGVNADHLVTWVESHDNYAGDENQSTAMNPWQIKMAWAAVAARAYTTPLYFNRPQGYGKFGGSIGNTGNDNWKDPDVIAINKFHNAMQDEGEITQKLTNTTFMIERGNKGCVIVNLEGSKYINTAVNLPDGTYTNRGSIGGTFTVSGGKLSQNIPEGIIVLYNTPYEKPTVSASPAGGKFVDSVNVTLNTKNSTRATYSINGKTSSFKDGEVITIGKDAAVNDKITLTLNAEGPKESVKETYTYTKVDKISTSKVYFYNNSLNWSKPTVYIYNDSSSTVKEAAKWPGVSMNDEGNGVYSYTVPENFGDAKVIFSNNGVNQYPESNKPGLALPYGSCMQYKDGKWEAHKDQDKNKITTVICKKPAGWNNVKLYVYNDSSSTIKELSPWPGVQMENRGNDEYIYKFKLDCDNAKVIFTDGVNQYPAKMQPGLAINSGATMEYNDGKWEAHKDKITTILCKKPFGWNDLKIYVYNDSEKTTKELSPWPGIQMTYRGNDEYIYKFTLDCDNARIIFTDGINQYPYKMQPGLLINSGDTMKYDNGRWECVPNIN